MKEVYRCETCGWHLVGGHQISEHGGHRLRYALRGSFWEILKIKWWEFRGLI